MPVPDKKTPLIPDVPVVNRTAKLAPAQVPEHAPPDQHAHKRFYLPEKPAAPPAAATPTLRPAAPPAVLVSEQATSKTGKAPAPAAPVGFITKSMARVQDAWKSGDSRQRQLVIAWAVFALIAAVALIIGATSVVRALVR